MGRFSDPGTGMSVVGTEATYPLVAVAIDNNSKVSQGALKWTLEHLVKRGQMLVLVHVNTKGTSDGTCDAAGYKQAEGSMRELFLPYRCFCTRKDVHCKDVVLDEPDVIKALVEFIASSAIEIMVLGAPVKGVLRRFKNSDVPQSVSKGAPDFCSVYIIGKEKAVNVRKALRAAPSVSPLRPHLSSHNPSMSKSESSCALGPPKWPAHKAEHVSEPGLPSDNSIKSPFTRGTSNLSSRKSFGDFSPLSDATDISFISSGRPSLDRYGFQPRLSNGSDSTFEHSFEMVRTPNRFSNGNEYSSFSQSSNASYSSQNMDDVESEIRRLRMELKQTMDMYSTACREALDAKQKLTELERHKLEEQKILCEARTHEEAAMQMIEEERAKRKAAVEAAEKSNRLAELEAKKRYSAEMLALKEAEEKKKLISSHNDLRYRKYMIDEIELATDNFNMSRKIGEGGYGPVFKGYLDHTLVAIKVLRPDAAQGRSQFQQEVEVLSCIRHPNMVILMGACPEYGCLVYEYMASGSLDDRLFRRGGTPPIPWKHRFRIAAEVATGLLFLHQAKPEPLVHRDLKPANILLDRNYVSKISDVGLARLVPQSLADDVTQYRMTSTAGTFCYIDPEYQQTGMLGVKSDIYSLGVLLLQIITARSPMGLTHNVSHAIENGKFADVLDPEVNDWPVEAAQRLAEIALGCAELRRKDRPDLATVVLPELLKLRLLGEENL